MGEILRWSRQLPMRTANDRFVYIIVGALVSYAMLETAISYAKERREQWAAWFNAFSEPFIKHPGRREFLRESLIKEEMTITTRAANDCECE